jgi:hypothetical protein
MWNWFRAGQAAAAEVENLRVLSFIERVRVVGLIGDAWLILPPPTRGVRRDDIGSRLQVEVLLSRAGCSW